MGKLFYAMAALMLFAAEPLPAADAEADEVTLTSGNRLTGRIRELIRGQLTFRIDGAGTVDIDKTNIETLRSARTFEIELTTGERLSGSIGGTQPGMPEIATATGPRVVAIKDIARITWIGASIRERSSATVELGFDFVSGGDAIDWTFSGEIDNRTTNYLTKATFDSLLRRQNHDTTQRRNVLDLTSRRFLQDRWFVIGELSAAEDLQLGLDSRYLAGLGGGRTLAQSYRTIIALYGGLDYALEDYSGVPGNDGSVEAFATVEWDWFEVGADIELTTKSTVYQSFDRSRTRLELNWGLRREIFRNFYWSLNVFESYDSDPPAELESGDFGLNLAIGLNLRRL